MTPNHGLHCARYCGVPLLYFTLLYFYFYFGFTSTLLFEIHYLINTNFLIKNQCAYFCRPFFCSSPSFWDLFINVCQTYGKITTENWLRKNFQLNFFLISRLGTVKIRPPLDFPWRSASTRDRIVAKTILTGPYGQTTVIIEFEM